MTVRLGDRDLGALLYITRRLRPRDREEIFANRWADDPDQLAMDTFNAGDFQWIAYKDTIPVASIGAAPLWPGVWSVWAYGTDGWPRVVLALTKHVRRFMIPGLLNAGAKRAHCFALETHDDARRWLTALGAEAEAVLDNYGKDGQAFVCYSWRRSMTEATDVRGKR